MKKILSLLIAITLVLMPVVANADNETTTTKKPINMYVFYAEWCGNCTNLHKYLSELEKDKEYGPMFKVVDYRVDNDAQYGANPDYQKNSELMDKVAKYFESDGGYIPFYIIGDEANTGFSVENSPEKIKELIKKAYESSNYVDVVDGIINDTIDKDHNKSDKLTDDQIGYIVLGIAAVVIVGIIIVRSKTKYYDDDIEEMPIKKEEKIEKIEKEVPKEALEEKEEEIVEEKVVKKEKTSSSSNKQGTKKSTTKKTNSKSTSTKKKSNTKKKK